MNSRCSILIAVAFALATTACGRVLTKNRNAQRSLQPDIRTEEEARYVLKESGKDIVYGESLGVLGAVILFPPYGLYKLGQAGAAAAGYKLDATNALPKKGKEVVTEASEAVLSAPGRATAWAAGERYRGEGLALKKLEAQRRKAAGRKSQRRSRKSR